MKKTSRYFPLFLAFLLGMVATRTIELVSAHGGDTNLIHGCVKSGVLNSGFLRIISATGTCNSNETPLDWNIQGIQGEPGNSEITVGKYVPSLITGNDFSDIDMRFKDFSNMDFSGTNLAKSRLSNAIFENSNFSQAFFSPNEFIEASSSNFKNTDFSNNTLANMFINGSDLTNANFSNTTISESVFTGSNLTNVNFNNATITNTTLELTITTGASFTGVTWNNVICPDNTNSNDHGNTCDGHLNP